MNQKYLSLYSEFQSFGEFLVMEMENGGLKLSLPLGLIVLYFGAA